MTRPVPYVGIDCKEKFCTKCGGAFAISGFYKTGVKKNGEPKYNSWCKSCIGKRISSYHKKLWGPDGLKHSAFKRTKTVRSYLTYLRGHATRRKRGEVASIDALELLWHNQNGKCALTGLDMTMELGRGVVQTNCSIDRINSDFGYEIGNVQLVCRAANVAKSNLTQKDFITLCRSVAENFNG